MRKFSAVVVLTLLMTTSGCTLLEVLVSYDLVEGSIDGIESAVRQKAPTQYGCRATRGSPPVSEERAAKVKAFCNAQFNKQEARKRCYGCIGNN